MRNAHTVADIRAAEQALMARVPPGALMQRAAAGLAAVCAGLVPRVYGSRVVVLAGSGDNGGDGLYAAARLARRGARVLAVAAGTRVHEAGAQALRAAGGRLTGPGDPDLPATMNAADLVLDGLLGIGGRGGLREPQAALAALAEAARAGGSRVVAVDLPSGVDADTGGVTGAAVRADLTVTFGTWKAGLLVDPGAGHAGLAQLVDIGLAPYLPAPPRSPTPPPTWLRCCPGPAASRTNTAAASLASWRAATGSPVPRRLPWAARCAVGRAWCGWCRRRRPPPWSGSTGRRR